MRVGVPLLASAARCVTGIFQREIGGAVPVLSSGAALARIGRRRRRKSQSSPSSWMGVTDMEQARRRQLERHNRQRSIESLHGAAARPATRERARTLHYVQQRQSLLPRRTPRRQRIAALDYGRAVLIGAVGAASHPDLVGRAGMFEEQHELFRRSAAA